MNTHEAPVMVSLKTLCTMYDWKYDTIWKKWKRGEFVRGYRDPAGGRAIRFVLRDVDAWARQRPFEILGRPSLIANEL